ncbi:CYFA0S14e02278g1_1 [Cyberlindnera fabianii]|uniref:rRNA adenine N(6)-methyltransferase n=1 Tax=Cyberlindnera fabianii TaxID=36022 RepID=A0A061B344_CYBFA|nr:Mitochondrial transcription factor 1 [Cyberlindnera fabianii]CDR44367.1 CYFA0S14e02278g1_1 [Cyberlindnera fabianii]
MVRVPLPPIPQIRKYLNTSFLTNPKIATKIADSLNYNYNGKDLSILDVYSGNMLMSCALHNALRPNQHLLLEPRLAFSKHIDDHITSLSSSDSTSSHTMEHLKLNPFNWSTYLELTDPKTGILQPGKETRDHIHSKLLMTGYIHEEGLLMQWLACMGNQNWIQRFGNVRMLLWVPEASAIKVLAGAGAAARHKCSLVRETFSDTRLLATTDTPKLAKDAFDKTTLREGKTLVIDADDFSGSPMSLLEINPKDHSIEDVYSWDFVTKNLMILRTKTVAESVRNLGAGAGEYFDDKLPRELMKKRVKDLVADDFVHITRVFDLWAFKPDDLWESTIDL